MHWNLSPRYEHLYDLKIINSWRFLFSKQKRSTIGQFEIYTSAQKRAPSNISEWCVDILKKSPPEITSALCVKLLPGSFVTQCTAFVHWNLSPRYEHLYDLKIINSWRFLFSKQKRSTIGQFEIYSLTIYSQKNIFWLSYQQLREKLFRIIYPKRASCFSSSRNLYERYQLFVLIVYGSLRDYFSPLYIENKVSSCSTFATIFFSV